MNPRTAPPRRHRRGPGARVVGVLLGVTFAGVIACEGGCQRVEAPWSVGNQTLTGTWEGPLRAGLGGRYRLFLDMRYSGRTRSAGTNAEPDNLEGTARVCTPAGEIWEYALAGTSDRKAENVRLRLTTADPERSALNLPLTGTWQGDRFSVEVTDNPFEPDGRFVPGPRKTSSDDPDDSFRPAVLEKADRAAFEAACRALGR